jgi:uncharacterized membrane protein
MWFKFAGVLLLVLGAYLALQALVLSGPSATTPLHAEVYLLGAIVLLQVVRVLQAEKHHREREARSRDERSRVLYSASLMTRERSEV